MQNSRPPLRKLPDIFMQLKEDFKQIILNNIDTLFGLEFYQEQMYFILKLTNGKQKLQIVNFLMFILQLIECLFHIFLMMETPKILEVTLMKNK